MASKLIRYDETDQSDVQFLHKLSRFTLDSVDAAVKTLPKPFDSDALVLQNLANLKTDLDTWNDIT